MAPEKRLMRSRRPPNVYTPSKIETKRVVYNVDPEKLKYSVRTEKIP